MTASLTDILESRDIITAALQLIGLLSLAGFWLLYFVCYHHLRRELRVLEGNHRRLRALFPLTCIQTCSCGAAHINVVTLEVAERVAGVVQP